MNKKLMSLPEYWTIQDLKRQLQATDYKALKYAEGLISDADYEQVKAERQAMRDEINRLELIIEEKLEESDNAAE